ncbi:DNA-directed DNA/RNA polymerase mu [Mixophyes fleayi]|uniref:DNA-directed DNA/RNA polymerase mu n=1 Tax=Mixophyes fleayi TaxID=3061075 RepID=UPI003F4DE817
MFPIPLKRRKREVPEPTKTLDLASLFPDVCVYLVERRMGSARRSFLTALAQRKGFCVAHEYSDAVTHVVSEQNTLPEVLSWIERKSGKLAPVAEGQRSPHILDISWFTESMSSGKPAPVEKRHCLGVVNPSACSDKPAIPTVSPYACQRRTPLIHHNPNLTNALEILARAAAYQGSEVRCLGFTRAASVLKSLPFKLQSAEEAKDLVWCGGHCKTVIQEILEYGVCSEVEVLNNSEQFQCMELLTGIFGVGVRTAERWYKDGVRNLSDLKDPKIKLTADQRAGLEHYTDLQQLVTRAEAERVERLVRDALRRFVPDIQITMTGGFSRGKQQGHDVDFLITHPDDRALTRLLKKAVDWLDGQGILLYHHMKERSHAPHERFDGHETCYAIFALPSSALEKSEAEAVVPGEPCSELTAPSLGDKAPRRWRAVRVDLVVTPYKEYPYALLGWTGSKHFEREMRRFSWQEKKQSLSSHGLYDAEKKCSNPATSEEDIFAHLGLLYVPPSDRNA